MFTPILATKLYVPPPRPKVVLRPRLIERLNEGLPRTSGVTLISAPAGFGKTTLVSEWVAGCERPAAWLSLDEGDNDPTRFLACLVAALQTIVPTIGAGVLGVLQSPQRYRQRPAEVRVERALHLHVNRDEAAIQQVIAQLVCLESCCYDSTQRNIQ